MFYICENSAVKPSVRTVIITVVVITCLGGALWMFNGEVAGESVIGNAQVLGALASLAALVAAMVPLWRHRQRAAAPPVTAKQVDAAVEFLASETLRTWRGQAKDRRITTPSPASVRWAWAGKDIAVPVTELHLDIPVAPDIQMVGESMGRVLTSGVVTQLREQLYQPLRKAGGRIIILGGAGAGKTAAMLLLLIEILKHRPPNSDEPVPMWLTLGGWNPKTSLLDWAATTLTRDYPGVASTATELIRTGRVALFLDGLDEIAPGKQGQALRAIDRETDGLRVVLTSRPNEYRAALADGQLYGAAVIEVLPVNVNDATTFLLAEQLVERRQLWRQITDSLRDKPDSVAARTLNTPLALSLARDTYTDRDPVELLDEKAHPSPEALLRHLLTRYLTLAYPDQSEYTHATYWLSWIAHHMGTNRDLRWWDIPAWAPRWQVPFLFGLIVTLVVGGMAGLVVEPETGLVLGPVVGGMAGIGLTYTLNFSNELFEGPQAWPPRGGLHDERVVVSGEHWHVHGLFVGFGYMFAAMQIAGFLLGLTVLFVTMVGFRRVIMLGASWSARVSTAEAMNPLEVHRSDYRRVVRSGLPLGLFSGISIGFSVAFLFQGGPIGGIVVGIGSGLAFGLMVGLGPAGELILSQMAWRLRGQRVRFLPLLQTALNRQVLRQAGALYQFRHAALQDYLTTREHSEGRRRDRREVEETCLALRSLWIAIRLSYSSSDGYNRQAIDKLYTVIAGRPLSQAPDIVICVDDVSRSWWAWRKTVHGWVFGIGNAGDPRSALFYDGPVPPPDGPTANPSIWTETAGPKWI
jgi:NACHT domain-containing protein